MNHHLRFAGPASFAAGVILTLSSCSTTEVKPPAPDPGHEITYEILIYDGRVAGLTGKGPAILDSRAVEILTKNIDQSPPFKGTIGGRFGKSMAFGNKKDFVYPSAYDPPKFSKPNQSQPFQTGAFPVTPAQPKNFVTTKVGTTVDVTGSQTPDGHVALRVKLDRKILLGFVNHGKPITTDATDWLGRKVNVVITENRQEEPRFSEYLRDVSLTLAKGQYLALFDPGTYPPEHGKPSYQEKRPPGFLALIRPIFR